MRTEHRTFWGVEVEVVRDVPTPRGSGVLIRLPDREREVRTFAYDNTDEACAAEVAAWRLKRIRKGVDRPGV